MIRYIYRKLRAKLKLRDTVTVSFYMKSGRKIKVRGVDGDQFKFTCNGNAVVKIEGFMQNAFTGDRFILRGMDLSQIEAIEVY